MRPWELHLLNNCHSKLVKTSLNRKVKLIFTTKGFYALHMKSSFLCHNKALPTALLSEG